MIRPVYTVIEHPADLGFEVVAESLPALFELAALSLFDLMWQPASTVVDQQVTLQVCAGDLEELLVNFLEEFLYLYDVKSLVFTSVVIESISSRDLVAQAWGHKFTLGQDRESLGVKAVTYHQIMVSQQVSDWKARVVLDI